MTKIKRIKSHLKDQDLESFARFYDIEREMKRIFNQ